jgi:hypothetical protein
MNKQASRNYTSDEFNRIMRRALALKQDDVFSHQDLLNTAKELGLDWETVEAAIAAEQKEYEDRNRREAKLKRRKARFRRHLWSYIIIIGALLLMNIFTSGAWWFQWPALGWGIGLALNFRSAYFPVVYDKK